MLPQGFSGDLNMSLQHFEDIWERCQGWEATILTEMLNILLVVSFNVEEQNVPRVLLRLKFVKEFCRVVQCRLFITAESG
jgi:hypothetical protein